MTPQAGGFARRGWRGLDMAAHAVARDVCAAGRPGAVVSKGRLWLCQLSRVVSGLLWGFGAVDG